MGALQQFTEPALQESHREQQQPSEWGWTRSQRIALGVLVGLLLVVVGINVYLRPALLDDHVVVLHGEAVRLPTRVDPNTASLEELTRIPHIGEKVGAKLVAYREARKGLTPDGIVFRTVEDLSRIPGLGKKTAMDLAPFFEFPEDSDTQPAQ